MKFDIFESYLRIIGYWSHEDDAVIEELFTNERKLIRSVEHEFRKELNLNLLEKETTEGKRDLLKYYIYEFKDIIGLFTQNEWLLFDSVHSGGLDDMFYEYPIGSEPQKADTWQKYVLKTHELFILLFDEIQAGCIKFGINTFDLCNELDFRTDIFDGGITLCYEDDVVMKMKNDNSSKKPRKEDGSELNGKIRLWDSVQNNKGVIGESGLPFINYIEGPYNDKIAEAIKIEYTGQKGSKLRFMIDALKSLPGQGKLIIPNRGFSLFYNEMSKYFGWDIGSYTSINDYNMISKKEVEEAVQIIKAIIDRINKEHAQTCKS